jgi:hypothetical protein
MTKGELLEKLKPFTDETDVYLSDGEYVTSIGKVKYIAPFKGYPAAIWLESQ